MLIFEFVGIPSGNGEEFCLDVTPEVFYLIKKRKPDEWDKSYFNKGLYHLYPSEFFTSIGKSKVRIKIEIKELKEGENETYNRRDYIGEGKTDNHKTNYS